MNLRVVTFLLPKTEAWCEFVIVSIKDSSFKMNYLLKHVTTHFNRVIWQNYKCILGTFPYIHTQTKTQLIVLFDVKYDLR